MRLTPELIGSARVFLNPLLEREIELRGRRLAAIENLGALKDQVDVLDVSDNECVSLRCFAAACSLLSLRCRCRVSGVGCRGLANLSLLFACFCLASRLERLDNFPKLRRLKWILASNNAISRIQDNLVNTLPNLKVLVLSNNRISVLSEITKLKGLRYVAEHARAQR
jgi:U2 small nuclear ribonucleoprotein A'